MMNRKLALFLLLPFLSCASPEKLATDRSNDRISFGKSGGFTNVSVEYVLFDKGMLCKVEEDGLLRICRINGKEMGKVDSLLKEMDFQNLDLHDTGNITYHIKTLSSGTEKEVKWTDSTDHPLIKELYNTLMDNLKDQS